MKAATSYVTTFNLRKVAAGRATAFGMVVVPVEPAVSAKALAKNVSMTTASDGAVEAVIKSGSQSVIIHVDDKDWSVAWQPNEDKAVSR